MPIWMLLDDDGQGAAVALQVRVSLGLAPALGQPRCKVRWHNTNPSRLNPVQQSVLEQSTQRALLQAYKILRGEDKIADRVLTVDFTAELPHNLTGRSGELACALAVIMGFWRCQQSVAATGIINEQGEIEAVEGTGLGAKLQAAIRAMPSTGGVLFYPAKNQADIPPDLAAQAQLKQIKRVPIGHLAEVAGALGLSFDRWKALETPYRGLEALRSEDASLFYGRSEACNRLLELLHKRVQEQHHTVLILGSSGSGKSSLLQAGLLPTLAKQVPPVYAAIFRPRAALNPQALPAVLADWCKDWELAEEATDTLIGLAVAADFTAITAWLQGYFKAGGPGLALGVDQLEELFTLQAQEPASELWMVRLLAGLAQGGVQLILTLRSDFYASYQQIPELVALCQGGHYDLLTPQASELRDIISQPAFLASCEFEAGLVDRILNDVGNKTEILPLLGFTLQQLYVQRQGKRMTHAAYEGLGTLKGAIGEYAEAAYQALGGDEQQQLASVVRQLVVLTADAKAVDQLVYTARPVRRAQFAAGGSARRLVDALITARLLVVEGDGRDALVRVAHEALLTHWRRIRELLAANVQDVRLRTRLDEQAQDWQQKSKQPSYLLHGLPLYEARDLFKRQQAELSPLTVAYLQKSIQKQRNKNRVVASLAIFVVMIAVLTTWNIWSLKQAAQRQQYQAESLVGFMLHDVMEILEPLGRSEWIERVAKSISQYFATTPQRPPDDDLARTYELLGDAFLAQGKWDQAIDYFEKNRLIFTQLNQAQRLAETHNRLGDAKRALGDKEAVRAHFQAAFEIRRQLLEQSPAHPKFLALQNDWATSHERLGKLLLRDFKQPQEALERYIQPAYQMLNCAQVESAGMSEREQRSWWEERLQNCIRLDYLLAGVEPENAQAHYQRALERVTILRQQDNTHANFIRQEAAINLSLGDRFYRQGALRSTVAAYYDKALALYQSLVAIDPVNVGRQYDLYGINRRLSDFYREPEPCRSLPYYQQAKVIIQRLNTDSPRPNAAWQEQWQGMIEQAPPVCGKKIPE